MHSDPHSASGLAPGFEEAFEQSPMPMLIHCDGLVLAANSSAADYLGFGSQAEMAALPLCQLLIPDDGALQAPYGPRFDADPNDLLARPWAADEIEYQHRDGHRVVAQVTHMPVAWRGRQAQLDMLRDETDRLRLHSRLMVADRMVSIGTLAAGIAHEINNPLTYILGNLEALHEDLPYIAPGITPKGSEEIGQLVSSCLEGVERVRVIVRDLKSFATVDQDSVCEVDLHNAIESAIQMATGEIKHRALLVREFGAPPSVVANPGRIAQVIVNLLLNAAQAMPPGGADRHEIRIRTAGRADGHAVIEVKDTGVGIPAEVVDRVFDPFFTTKSVGDGTGLGLSVAQNIITSAGGMIEVDSEVGLGTVFRLILPGVGCLGDVDPSADRAEETSGPRPSVLLIDDEPGILDLLARALRQYEVVRAGTGREALNLLSCRAFDLVICDVQMPDVTGIEVHRHLAEQDAAAADRMVFMTGGAFTAQGRSFLDQVPNEVLHKPFGLKTALSVAEAVLADSAGRRAAA